jgi:uncharacterized protein YukE
LNALFLNVFQGTTATDYQAAMQSLNDNMNELDSSFPMSLPEHLQAAKE